ncbi:MAG: Hsp33 family molecular chaperone HslO [Pseudomonadota bacterium]|nr:Hsp33 family molecular chaperone HslO [Pseudomonadota bacterium]
MSGLVKFLFEGLPVRGMLVRLTDSWRELLSRRVGESAYAPEVQSLLGEMTAAGLLMQANIAFDGALVLQLHGDGPVRLAVCEVQSDLSFRSTATVIGDVTPGSELAALVNPGGGGRCAITLDPKRKLPGQAPYQGVVALHGDQREPLQQLAQVLEHYMLQSEQLDTRLVLAANGEVAAGLLIQRMPVQGEGNLAQRRNEDGIGLSEAYNRISILAASLSKEELLSLTPDEILHRLFWEETVRRFDPLTPSFACTCSRERVMNMLRGLGREESESLIEERGEVEVGCEFCGLKYRFDAVDVGEMFTSKRDQPPASEAVQ